MPRLCRADGCKGRQIRLPNLEAWNKHQQLVHPGERNRHTTHRQAAEAVQPQKPPIVKETNPVYRQTITTSQVRDEDIITLSGFSGKIKILEIPSPPLSDKDDQAGVQRPASDIFVIAGELRRGLTNLMAVLLANAKTGRRYKIGLGSKNIMEKSSLNGVERQPIFTRNTPLEIASLQEFAHFYDASIHFLWQEIENFTQRGSGWRLIHIAALTIYIYQLPSLQVGEYQRTPRELAYKRGTILNIHSDDNFCFKWATVAGWCHAKLKNGIKILNPEEQVSYMPYEPVWSQALDFSQMQAGVVSRRDLVQFEVLNKTVALNVFEYKNQDAHYADQIALPRLTEEDKIKRKKTLRHIYCSPYIHHKDRCVINLLILTRADTGHGHVVCIKQLNTLFRRGTNVLSVCPRCCKKFYGRMREENLAQHIKSVCQHGEYDRYNVNFKSTQINWNSVSFKFLIPFQIVADFETWCRPGGVLNNNTDKRTVVSTHQLMGYSLGVMCTPNVSDHLQSEFKTYCYHGPEAEGNFIVDFLNIKTKIQQVSARMKRLHEKIKPWCQFSRAEKKASKKNICWICEEAITNQCSIPAWQKEKSLWQTWVEKKAGVNGWRVLAGAKAWPEGYFKGPRVLDHCHFSGRVRGSTHVGCNLNHRWRLDKIPLWFHNGSR